MVRDPVRLSHRARCQFLYPLGLRQGLYADPADRADGGHLRNLRPALRRGLCLRRRLLERSVSHQPRAAHRPRPCRRQLRTVVPLVLEIPAPESPSDERDPAVWSFRRVLMHQAKLLKLT